MLVTLREVLSKAREGKYAVGLFNTTDTEMLEAAIETAEELRSPIIIGTAEVLLPHGELRVIAPSMIEAAKRASVPVVVHFDHGLTFERCIEAIKLGFSSVMFDGSALSERENTERTAEMAKIARAFGCSIEAEIGHVGGAEDMGGEADPALYTETEAAVRFSEATGADALAVAVGTAHGRYTCRPALDFKRLSEIAAAVKIPLVLHGGSGLSAEDFRRAVECGISKINVFTDLCAAGERATALCVAEGRSYLQTHDLRREYIAREISDKIKLFGSALKA